MDQDLNNFLNNMVKLKNFATYMVEESKKFDDNKDNKASKKFGFIGILLLIIFTILLLLAGYFLFYKGKY